MCPAVEPRVWSPSRLPLAVCEGQAKTLGEGLIDGPRCPFIAMISVKPLVISGFLGQLFEKKKKNKQMALQLALCSL